MQDDALRADGVSCIQYERMCYADAAESDKLHLLVIFCDKIAMVYSSVR